MQNTSQSGDIKMPKTKTPLGVRLLLLLIITILYFGMFIFVDWVICLIVVSVILAATNTLYSVTTPAYHCAIVLNVLTREKRVVYEGFSLLLPWEKLHKVIDLRFELAKECMKEFPTLDAKMIAEYIFTIRPCISIGNPDENILRFASYEPTVIQKGSEGFYSQKFSDYYGKNSAKDLIDKEAICNSLFGDDGTAKAEEDIIKARYGIESAVRLVSSKWDQETQKFRDLISGAKSFDEAIGILMGKDGKKMSKDQAIRVAKLMNFPENVREDMYDVKIDGLSNLRHLNVVGGLGNKKQGGMK